MIRIKCPILALMMGMMTMPAWAVGTVSQAVSPIGRDPGSGPDNRVYQIAINWVADATTGTVPSTLLNVAPFPAMQGMRLVSLEIKPGTPAPTNAYSVTLTDSVGVDLALGAASSLSNVSSAALSVSTLSAPLFGSVTFNLTNNLVNSAQGTVLAFFAPLSQGSSTFGGASLTANNPFTGNNSFTGTNTFSQINKTVIVDGTVYPKTDAGINAAIVAAGCGGHVFLPAGTYTLNDTLRTQEILISFQGCGAQIEFNGEGGEQTILQVGSSVPTTEDIIRIAPTSGASFGIYFHDFWIQPITNNTGRYGINFDATNGALAHVTVARVRVGTVGNTLANYAIFHTNTVPVCNPMFLATFQDNTFVGGLSLTNIGDSILLIRNNITGPRDVFIQAPTTAGCHTDGGSHGFAAVYNNITTTGATVIKSAWQGYFAFNDVEQTVTSTEANNALLDIQGVSGAGNPTENFVVEGNYLGCNAAFSCTDTIRVDQAYHTVIKHNYLPRGNGAVVHTTANATRTEILENTHAPNGELITTWLNDQGTGTTVKWIDENTNIDAQSTPFAWGAVTSGTRTFAIAGVQFRVGSASVVGFSPGDPTLGGADTGISRLSAASLAFGNGVNADNTALLDATTYVAESNFRAKEIAQPAGVAAADVLYGDSTAHLLRVINNNGTSGPLVTAAPCNTSQKTESGADANLLTCAIPAQAGTYRVSIQFSVSAANTATIGWTATWTNSNGTAQAPTNILMFQTENLATAFLTGTAAAGTDYFGSVLVDVNNAGTSIVVKTTFSGTSITAKASATVERII